MDTAVAIFQWFVIGFVGVVFLTLVVLFALKAVGVLPPGWGERRGMHGGRSGSSGSWGGDSGSWDGGSSDSGGDSGGGGGD